jgi:hypothetical protein
MANAFRAIVNVDRAGEQTQSQWFIGEVQDMKRLAESYDLKPLYCVKVASVKKGASGYFEWFAVRLGVNLQDIGHA